MNRLVLLLLLPGCASWMSNQVPDSVVGALSAASTPESQAALARLLDNPQMHDALEATARALVDGSLDGIGDGPSDERVRRLSAALVEGAKPALKDALDLHLQDVAFSTLDHGFDRMLRELAKAKREGTFDAMAASVAKAAGAEMTASLRGLVGDAPAAELGRALAASFEHDLAPALSRTFDGQGDGDLRKVLGDTTQVVAEGALRGLAAQVRGELGDAMDERLRAHEEWLEEKTNQWWAFIGELAAVAMVVFAVLGWLVWRERQQTARRETELINLLSALREEADADVIARVVARAAAPSPGRNDR